MTRIQMLNAWLAENQDLEIAQEMYDAAVEAFNL